MGSVDDRVVNMQFNNNKFESNVGTTLGTLDKLKQKLNFSKSKDSLGELEGASNKVTFGQMGASVEKIGSKFTAMGVIAFTALQNITNKAIQTGTQLLKSIFIAPRSDGFAEYETNMNSIQTVLANTMAKGSKLKDVNAALNELNTYSDKTIYNFSQMAKNIGTFTAAGIDLKTSTQAIKGIANIAAMSGSSADQASTAMYQLSQAMASGSVKLMDWNSVVNAGMGGEIFQKSLFETGKALHTLTKVPMNQTFEQWKAAGNTFRDSLKDGWITGEVLTTTLSGFTGDLTDAQLKSKGYNAEQIKQIQAMGKMGVEAATKVRTLTALIGNTKEAVGSGWSATFAILLGNFDEATDTFTKLSTVLGNYVSESANARNKVLGDWKKMGGRTVLIDGITNIFKALGAVIKPIKEAFREFFPPTTGKDLFDLTSKFRAFTKLLIPSGKTVALLKRSFEGLFAVFSIIKGVIVGVASVFGSLFKAVAKLGGKGGGDGILGLTAKIGDWLKSVDTAIKKGEVFTKFFDKISGYVIAAIVAINNFGIAVKEAIGRINWQPYIDAVKGAFDATVNFFKNLKIPDSFMQGLATAKKAVVDLVSHLKMPKGSGFNFDWATKSLDTLKNASGGIKESFSKFGQMLAPIFDKVKQAFSAIWDKIKEAFNKGNLDTLQSIGKTGIFAAIIALILKFKKGLKGLSIGDLFDELKESLEGIQKVLNGFALKLKAEALKEVSVAIAIFAASIVALSFIPADKLSNAMGGLGIALAMLLGSMGTLDKIASSTGMTKMPFVAGSLILLSAAMLGMSFAVRSFATLDTDTMAKGLGAFSVVLYELALAIKPIAKESAGFISGSVGLIALATAMNILALAILAFGKMDFGTLAQGIIGVTAALAGISAALKLMPKDMALTGGGVLAIALAMNVLYLAVRGFGSMSWEELIKGIGGAAGALAAIGASLKLMPRANKLVGLTGSLIGISVAMLLLSKSVKSMGDMSWDSLLKGLGGLAVSMKVLAVAAKSMTGATTGAMAFIAVAAGVLVLAKAIEIMGNMSIGTIAIGLGVLAAALGVMALAGMAMTPLVPVLAALGGSILGLGLGMGAAAAGIGVFLLGLAAFAVQGAKGVQIILTAISGLIEMIPEFALKMGEGLVNFIIIIGEKAPEIVGAFLELLNQLLQGIIDSMPKIVEAMGAVLQGIIKVIKDNLPDLIAMGLEMLISLLQGIQDNIGEVTTKVLLILEAFLKAVADNLGGVIAAGVDLIVALVKGIGDSVGKVVMAIGDVIVKILSGLGSAVTKVIAAGAKLISDLIIGIGKGLGDIVTAAVDTALAFMKAIADNTQKFVDGGFKIVIDLINGIANSIRENTSDLLEAGWNLATALIDGIVDGIGKIGGRIWDALKGFAEDAWHKLTHFWEIFSPSHKTHWVGEMIMQGMADGIDDGSKGTINAVDKANDAMIDSMQAAMKRIPSIFDEEINVNPTITPIIDLSHIKKSAKEMGNILDVIPVRASLGYSSASAITAIAAGREQSEMYKDAGVSNNTTTYTQNITAPKALSSIEIYRNTKNLINMHDQVPVS